MRQANHELFAPHGLYAMVATFSRVDAQIYTVGNSVSYQRPPVLATQSPSMPARSFDLAECISPESPKRAREGQNDSKKGARRPTSKRKVGQRSASLLKHTFQEAFHTTTFQPSGADLPEESASAELTQHDPAMRPFESGDLAQVSNRGHTITTVV